MRSQSKIEAELKRVSAGMNLLATGGNDFNMHYGAVQALQWVLGKVSASPSDAYEIIREFRKEMEHGRLSQ
jgi:hypothetical protein